ncbi:unnamed protein product [Didymodactylos carnosus]|uniref:Uncharacterized protein n=1 Tax=Didymodactylos carnosus TaxID=1234261 RepID=A0A814WXJ0_9BILA|nr:unnamed protein product [Didymodactylos carnosus]CAF1208134.1 unnamed protein product [Didymodactylos carnosus]CAF3658952.1 unnamed protein product [Didymodactylos carnosus]CAF3972277.1 unnamed protein product [Didymodactylos carnosus]
MGTKYNGGWTKTVTVWYFVKPWSDKLPSVKHTVYRRPTVSPLTHIEQAASNGLATKTLHFEKGVTYVGQVNEKNQKHGYGKLVSPGKMEYSGQFCNDEIHGFGKMKHANGTKYEGEYKHNLMDGRGILTYSNHQEYRGEFKQGLRHGKGVYWNSDGTARHGGTYKNDEYMCCCGLC